MLRAFDKEVREALLYLQVIKSAHQPVLSMILLDSAGLADGGIIAADGFSDQKGTKSLAEDDVNR